MQTAMEIKNLAEIQKLKDQLEEAKDALRANLIFHTPVMMRKLGRSWDEYEQDAINRTRKFLGKG